MCTTGGVQLYFSISLHEKDRKLLEQIKIYFGPGGGQIYKHGEKSIQYRVLSIKDMPVIISHFYLYPLMSKKSVTYKLFKLAFNLFINKEHLTNERFRKNSGNKEFDELWYFTSVLQLTLCDQYTT